MTLHIYMGFFCMLKILFICLRIKFPKVGMETDLNNFNIGFQTEFRMIVNPHTSIIKLSTGIQKCNDKYFTNTLARIKSRCSHQVRKRKRPSQRRKGMHYFEAQKDLHIGGRSL